MTLLFWEHNLIKCVLRRNKEQIDNWIGVTNIKWIWLFKKVKQNQLLIGLIQPNSAQYERCIEDYLEASLFMIQILEGLFLTLL